MRRIEKDREIRKISKIRKYPFFSFFLSSDFFFFTRITTISVVVKNLQKQQYPSICPECNFNNNHLSVEVVVFDLFLSRKYTIRKINQMPNVPFG